MALPEATFTGYGQMIPRGIMYFLITGMITWMKHPEEEVQVVVGQDKQHLATKPFITVLPRVVSVSPLDVKGALSAI
jgi:hypothetical protein